MSWYLFLDANLIPEENIKWKVCRSSEEAINYAKIYGLPRFMSLGYDLGIKNGIPDNTVDFIKKLNSKIWDQVSEPPMYRIHTQNLTEMFEIESYMDDWFRNWTPTYNKG